MLRTVVELAAAGRFDELTELFAPELRAVVSADIMRIAWAKEVGAVRHVGEAIPLGDNRFSVLLNGSVELRMSMDDQGRVNGLRLTAPETQWQPPSYVQPEHFTEQEVLVGTQPGALVLPHNGNSGRSPASPTTRSRYARTSARWRSPNATQVMPAAWSRSSSSRVACSY